MTPSERLRKMVEKATPGPWENAGKKRPGVVSHAEYDRFERPYLVAKPTDFRDAPLIALAPEMALLLSDWAERTVVWRGGMIDKDDLDARALLSRLSELVPE